MRSLVWIVVFFWLAGCDSAKNFKDLEEGVKVQLLGFEDRDRMIKDAEFIEIRIYNSNELLLEQIFRNLEPGALASSVWYDDLSSRFVGDSLHYELDCSIWQSSIFSEVMKVNCDEKENLSVSIDLKLSDSWTMSEYTQHLSELEFHDYEEEFLFLKEHVLTDSRYGNLEQKGKMLWELIERDDSRDSVRLDSAITIHYKGYLLNDEMIDVSPINGLSFILGEKYQVIPGLEYAISQSKYGDSLVVFLPPFLAFGPKGSANGKVPPYSPVRYHLRISELNSPDLAN